MGTNEDTTSPPTQRPARVTTGRRNSAYVPAPLDDLGLDPFAFRIYMHLVRRSNAGRKEYWESRSGMAEVCGMSEATVKRSLAVLRQLGMLDATERQGRPTLYTLTDESRWVEPGSTGPALRVCETQVPGSVGPTKGKKEGSEGKVHGAGRMNISPDAARIEATHEQLFPAAQKT